MDKNMCFFNSSSPLALNGQNQILKTGARDTKRLANKKPVEVCELHYCIHTHSMRIKVLIKVNSESQCIVIASQQYNYFLRWPPTV